MHSLVSHAYPEYARRPERAGGSTIRVGYVSSCFYNHSVQSTHGGYITNLPREKFETFVYHVGDVSDGITRSLAQRAAHFFQASNPDLEAVAGRIHSDRLDVLVYPDLGMNSLTMKLACLRLAPTQCTSWGHPITSGLPSIDYFLSSALMEPAGAQAHYSETLVPLGNLGVSYSMPDPEVPDLDLSKYELPSDRPLLLCAQSPWKLLPQYDFVFARISQRLPGSLILFFSSVSPAAGRALVARLARGYGEHGLDVGEHTRLVPRMKQRELMALTKYHAAVFLDPIGWSGCNTTFQAISVGTPIVTCPGKLMRERHTYAILKMMGLDECIAESPEEYIRIASALVSDPAFRAAVAERIRSRRHVIFEDEQCTADLAEFYSWAVRGC